VLRSLFAGISGLRTHQTLMDVVSNNIANVNTTGFKASSATFQDTLSQTLRAAGAPSSASGGLNPAQVGLGVQLAGITTNFGQGSTQTTGRNTDLMIQGDGFFVMKSGSQQLYTRAGAFNFDSNGLLVNSEGMAVQGWAAVNGVVNTDGPLGDLLVPAGTQIPPVASTTFTGAGNIPAGTTTPQSLGQSIYDTAGNAHSLSVVLTPTGPNSFSVAVTDQTDPSSTVTAGTLQFNADGSYDPASTAATITTADGTAVTIDLSGATMYGGSKSFAVTKVDGAAAGTLQQFQIEQDGSIIGTFSNGQRQTLGKLALANFTNPAGLTKVGSTAFSISSNSGLPQIGIAGSGSLGTLMGGSLEMSNVDLAREFTNLIIAQRGFQANSRVITTSDTLLQELVDLKR